MESRERPAEGQSVKVADLFAALGLEVDRAAFAAADDAIGRIASTTALATAQVEHFSGVVLATMRAARGPVDDAVVSWDGWQKKAAKTGITLRGVAIAATAVGFALHTVRGFFGGVIEEFDKLDETSQRTGVQVEALQALGYAASFSGIEMESLAGSLGKFQKNADAASKGGKEAGKAFREAGVDADALVAGTISTEQALASVAETFAGMEDGAAKSALAQKLFGRSGADLIPFLNAGRDGIEALTKEARTLGIVVGKDDVKAFAEFDDENTRMRASWKAIKIQITRALLPAFKTLVSFLQIIAKNLDVVVLAVYSLAAAFVVLRGVSVAAAWATLKAWLIANGPLILMALAIMALILLFEDLYVWFRGGDSVMKDFYEAAKKWILEGVVGIFTKAWGGIVAGFRAMGELLIDAFKWLGDAFAMFFRDFVINPILWVVEKIKWLADKIAAVVDKVASVGGLSDFGSGVQKRAAELSGTTGTSFGAVAAGLAPPRGTTNTSVNATINITAPAGSDAAELARITKLAVTDVLDAKAREIAAQTGGDDL